MRLSKTSRLFQIMMISFGCALAHVHAEGIMRVYFGTYTGPRSQGIYQSILNPETGVLSEPQLAVETKNPSFLAVHPNRKFLYSVGEMSDFEGKKTGAVSAFSIDPRSGSLRLLNQQPSGGPGPCHLSLDAKGDCLLVANYGGGSIQTVPVLATGALGQPGAFIQHAGSSVDPKRQAGPHAHQIVPDPENRFALVCDLGLDKVLVYRMNARRSLLEPNDPPGASVEPGAGPRHLVFHPARPVIYVINEMGSSISVFDWQAKTGTLSAKQRISTLPAGWAGNNTGSEIAVHPSGRFVYGSNRGHNSLAIFKVNPKTGALSPAGHQDTGGQDPRYFAIDPTGEWVVAQNQTSNNILVFKVNRKTGAMTSAGKPLNLAAPVCAVFVRVPKGQMP